MTLTDERLEYLLGLIFMPEHGTYGASQQHKKLGIALCDECREARNAYLREYKRRRRLDAER